MVPCAYSLCSQEAADCFVRLNAQKQGKFKKRILAQKKGIWRPWTCTLFAQSHSNFYVLSKF